MKITVEIPDAEIRECVKQALVREILDSGYGTGAELRKEFKAMVKELIYRPDVKQAIIDQATKEAAWELKRKGMPALMQRMAEGGRE